MSTARASAFVLSLADKYAALAHEVWVNKMTERGWKHGAKYDIGAKTHDALVPWELLSESDRHFLRAQLDMDELEYQFNQVDYQRAPDRDFFIGEMRVGLRVCDADGYPAALDGKVVPIGIVREWTTSSSGELWEVCCEWPGGEVRWNNPYVGELARVDEIPAYVAMMRAAGVTPEALNQPSSDE